MGYLAKTISICATLLLVASVDDQTNLMQIKQAIKAGSERNVPLDDAASLVEENDVDEDIATDDDDEVMFEEYTEQEEAAPVNPTPAGCLDMGCRSGAAFSGPNCGGNAQSCEGMGLVVTGYYKSCGNPWKAKTCQTGWRVRCARCPAGVTAPAVTMPAPSPAIQAWVAPAAAAPGPAPPTPAPINMTMPKDPPVFAPAQFDSQAVKNAQAALAAAQALLAATKVNLTAAQNVQGAVQKNITLFSNLASTEQSKFLADRAAAVSFSKKRQVANVSIFKATKQMNTAFFAEKGATQGAQDSLVESTNFGKQRMYYQTVLVDAMSATKTCLASLHVSQNAVKQANAKLSSAKSAQFNYQYNQRKTNSANVYNANAATKQAMQAAINSGMSNAYAAASPGLPQNSVPPYGGGNPLAILAANTAATNTAQFDAAAVNE